MKILVTLDAKDYSKNILKDVARLAGNTLADIVFLGVQDETTQAPKQSLVKTLLKYQNDVYSYFSPEDLPYAAFSSDRLEEKGKGDWAISAKGMKEFTLRIKSGSVAKQTIDVAEEMDCDLVILGCSGKIGCEWDGEMNVPLRIAKDAPCSALVIKQTKRTNQIVSILDHTVVSQNSLEMINQLVTLNDAGLKIVGVQKKKDSKKAEVEKRMVELLKYYNDREINVWVKVLDSEEVKKYVTNSSREAIVALWMGKESLLKMLFSQSMVDKLLETTKSSLLILR
jgi:nucleotide-binding universal stress UspA family protein